MHSTSRCLKCTVLYSRLLLLWSFCAVGAQHDAQCSERDSSSLLQRGRHIKKGIAFAERVKADSSFVSLEEDPENVTAPSDPELDNPLIGPKCMRNTGGTCNIMGCNADRGPTECKLFYTYKCLCQEGFCASLDGRCRPSPTSIQVGNSESFYLRNVQWPDHVIKFNRWGNSLGVSKGERSDANKVKLFHLPSPKGQKPTQFLLSSVEYPDYVATSNNRESCHTIDIGGDRTRRDCHWEYYVQQQWMYQPERKQILKLRRASWAHDDQMAVTIEGLLTPNHFWYVPHASWTVSSYFGDPGPQGYWVFDPPLPDDLLPALSLAER